MKYCTTLIALLFPFLIFGQECDFFSTDTLNVCGYQYGLEMGLEENTITYTCFDNQYLSIDFGTQETNMLFSSCGIYELIYTASDGSCIDTLLIQVSDPNSTSVYQSTDIGLDYGAIDCPSGATAECFENSVSISISTGTPTPVWSFCSVTTCQSTVYSASSVGNEVGCLSDSIVIDTVSVFSSNDYCSDSTQNAFIVLDTNGDTVVSNTFLDYLSQLQDSSYVDCFFAGLECSYTNTSTCYDSIVMDTTVLPIPVRIGGMWTMPDIDTLVLGDTTYFTYFNMDYELILKPGVDFYGPGELDVILNKIFITTQNDTIREFPFDFNLTLQWEEEWIIDTLLIIQEKEFDTDDNCFACGGVFSGGGFDIPEIPEFPCGPVTIYFPSICECEYEEPNISMDMISCNPRTWVFDASPSHYINRINGEFEGGGPTAILEYPTDQNIEIESFDFNGCVYYNYFFIEDYIEEFGIQGGGDLSCETTSTTLSAYQSLHFSTGSVDLSSTVWSPGGTGSSITVFNPGTYTATYIDESGCEYSASVYVGYDNTIECLEENPYANQNCEDDEDIICDISTFESFDYTMPEDNLGNGQPLCNGDGSPHNISWFSFVAFGGSYSIEIIPSDCYGSTSFESGIQVGLSSDCSFSNTAFCSTNGSQAPISVSSDNLIEGQVYNMFIDGLHGSICNYKMEILGDPEIPNLEPESMTNRIDGEYIQNANSSSAEEYCVGTQVRCQLQGIDIEGEYDWSIKTIEGTAFNGAASRLTETNTLNLTFDTKGTYEVCVDEIRNGCEEYTWSGQLCYTITTIKTEDEDFGTYYICEGHLANLDQSVFDELDPNEDGITGIYGNLSSYEIGTNTVIAYDAIGCSYKQEFDIQNHPSTDIPTVNVVECFSSLPMQISGIDIDIESFDEENVLQLDVTLPESNIHGCDSSVHYVIELLRFTDDIPTQSSCTDDGVALDLTYYGEVSSDETLTTNLIGPNGQVIASNVTESIYTIPHGSEDGIYQLLLSKSKGNASCDITREIELSFSDLIPSVPQITNGPLSLCAEEGIVTYLAINDDPSVNFEWSVDGNVTDFSITGEYSEYLSVNWGDQGGMLSIIAENECGLKNQISETISIHSALDISIISDEEVCQSTEFKIEIDVDESKIDSYVWDFDGAIISSDAGLGTYSIKWDTQGEKTIKLDAIDINGCNQILEAEIMVNDAPDADFSILSDSICLTDVLAINAYSIDPDLTQEWNFDGGSNISTEDPIVQFNSPGWKTITLTTHNSLCSSDAVSKSIFVEEMMDDVTISCVDQGLHALSFEWNEIPEADAYIVTINNQSPIQVSGTTYIAEELEENTEYTIEVAVVTDHRCPPSTAGSSCSTRACENQEFTFDIPEIICIDDEMESIALITSVENGETDFTWSGTNVVENHFNPNGLSEGIYTIAVMHQEEDCISHGHTDIRLVAPPEFSLIYDETICFGEATTPIEVIVESAQHTLLIDGIESESFANIGVGAHEIMVINSDQCLTTESILIESSSDQELTIIGQLEILEGELHTYDFDASHMEDIDMNSITWIVNGVDYCSGSECMEIQLSIDQDSEIELNGKTHLGCELFATLQVGVVEKEPKIFTPNIFSPNNDGLNDYWFVMANKEDIIIQNVYITDRWNNIVYRHNHDSTSGEMKWDGTYNGSNLQPGVYVYSIQYSVDDDVETVYGDVTIIR